MKYLYTTLLFVIGVWMIYLGTFAAPVAIVYPPVLSGVAFIIIAIHVCGCKSCNCKK